MFWNAIEQLPHILITTPIAGIIFPIPTLIMIWSFYFGRLFYGCGYRKSPGFRAGGACCMLCNFYGLYICAIWSCVYLMGRETDVRQTLTYTEESSIFG